MKGRQHSKGLPMSEPTMNAGLLIASARKTRFADHVVGWLDQKWPGELTHLDLRTYDLPLDLDTSQADARRFAQDVERLDALVILTPEYNHSYPGNLKVALDLLGKELAAMPVGFVSYGGISGGLRAVEHLRPVLSELHAMTIRNTVSFPMAWSMVDDSGTFAPQERSEKALEALAGQLAWWSDATRHQTHSRPYVS